MPVKKSVKKTPSKKEIEAAAASVEAAIEKLEVEEIEIETETVILPEITEEALAEDEKKEVETSEETTIPEEKEEIAVEETVEVPEQPAEVPQEEKVVDQEEVAEQVAETPNTGAASTEPEKTTSTPFSASEASEGGKKSKIIIVICLCIIFTILGFFGGYMYAKTMGVASAPAAKSSDIVIESTPIPTVDEVDLSEYSIEILNGSGVAGIAGTEQEALETDGFSVENTGNAETQDFTKTEIAVKSSVPKDFIQKLTDSLSERYVVKSSTEDLESDSTYDVVVTVGSESVVDE